MSTNREILEDELETCQDEIKGLSSYVSELKTMTAKHNTPKEQYESDLTKALHNIKYYEAEMVGIKKETVTSVKGGKPGTGAGTLLPKTKNQGIGAAVLSSISFVAGAFLGSRLKSGKSSKDRESGN